MQSRVNEWITVIDSYCYKCCKISCLFSFPSTDALSTASKALIIIIIIIIIIIKH